MADNTPLAGAYAFVRPGQAIELYRGPITLGSLDPTAGRIELSFARGVNVLWEATSDEGLSLREASMEIIDNQLGRTQLPIRVTSTSGFGEVLAAQLGTPTALHRVLVHWINLPWMLPASTLRDGGHRWAGRWIAETCGWSLTVDARPDLAEALPEAPDDSDFVFTHVAELRRTNGGSFSPSEAEDVLYGLQVALSFALGRWVAPALPVGFDSAGKRVWETWAPWRCDRFRGSIGWWDTHTSQDLRDFVDAYMERWTDPDSRPTVRHLAHHVIAANQGATTLEPPWDPRRLSTLE